MPGRAAYVNGRSGSCSMRLNFAGSAEADIREGLRRIARAIGPDAGLLGALTGAPAGATAPSEPAGASAGAAEMADVIELPRSADVRTPRARQDR